MLTNYFGTIVVNRITNVRRYCYYALKTYKSSTVADTIKLLRRIEVN